MHPPVSDLGEAVGGNACESFLVSLTSSANILVYITLVQVFSEFVVGLGSTINKINKKDI